MNSINLTIPEGYNIYDLKFKKNYDCEIQVFLKNLII